MWDKVRARGELENTLIVICSDHGEQLGDHNSWGKRQPWEPSLRVPLIVLGPGVAKNRVVELPVSTLDVVGLFLDRAGLSRQGYDAHTLEPLLRDGAAADHVAYLKGRPFVPSGLTYEGRVGKDPPVDFRAVVQRVNATHTMKVICCPAGCPVGNSHVPSDAPLSQLLAFNVGPGGKGDIENLNHTADASRLARHLPGIYATACLTASQVEELQPVERLPHLQDLPHVPIIIEPPQQLPPAIISAAALGPGAGKLATLGLASSLDAHTGSPKLASFATGEQAAAWFACVATFSVALLGLACIQSRLSQPIKLSAHERVRGAARDEEAEFLNEPDAPESQRLQR